MFEGTTKKKKCIYYDVRWFSHEKTGGTEPGRRAEAFCLCVNSEQMVTWDKFSDGT